ncbi:MAG TPA: hypothetical protein VK421_12215, partial [Pyrinomonadaceae bacterium]|nr:hypothetical protein [Pyrinomonadaceae bacterium]
EEAAAPPESAEGGLIVTDVSGSMNGFARPGSVRLFTIHDTLERSVRNSLPAGGGGTPIKRCYLGDGLDCQSPLQVRALDNPSSYNARESRLDLFLSQSPQKDADVKDAKAATDPLAPYRLAVLVTDGMQARAASGGGACLGGADPECMAYLLRQKAEQGYGIWMAMLMLPFNGTHYAERPLDDMLWQRIQQHAAEAGRDERFRGISFKVKRAGATPFTSYQFEGVKPLVVIALSKDVEAGRNFVRQFADSIRREAVVTPADAVYSIELAPLSVRPRRVAKISIAPTSSVDEMTQVAGRRRDDGLYDYLVECGRGGDATFLVNWEEGAGAQALPEGVRADFQLVHNPGSTLPATQLSTRRVTDRAFEVQLTCRPLKPGAYAGCLDLRAELKADPGADAFWAALNADNMYEAPERLYGLREMVQKVLAAATEKPRGTDRVLFRVERK